MKKTRNRFIFSLIISVFILNSITITQFGVCAKPDVIWHFKSSEWVRDVAISDDGSTISAVGYDQYIYLFNSTSNTPIWSYQASDIPWNVVLSANGDYILAGSNEGYVHFFTKDNSTPQWSYKTGATTDAVAICPDSAYMVVGSNDNRIYFFNKSGYVWRYHAGKSFISVALSTDGSVITGASSSGDYGKVYTFNKVSNSPLWNCDREYIMSVAISSDGTYIASGSGLSYPGITPRGNISFFHISSPAPLWYYETPFPARHVAISSNTQYIIAVHGEYYGTNNVLYKFDDTSHLIWKYNLNGYPNDLAISEDGRYIVIGLKSNRVSYFDSVTKKLLWTMGTPSMVKSVDITLEGDYIVVSDDSGNVWLIQTLTSNIPSFQLFPIAIFTFLTLIILIWSIKKKIMTNKETKISSLICEFIFLKFLNKMRCLIV